MSEHEDFEALLGAYALDAVEPDEARAIEEHLAICPRCRAELAAHLEVATLLAHSGAPAPEGLWERIGHETGVESAPSPARLGGSVDLAKLTTARHHRRMRWAPAVLAAVAASVVVVALSLQVSHLDGQVHALQSATRAQGLAPLVDSALNTPHRIVALTSATSGAMGTVVIASNGSAYWVTSNLSLLSSGRTYQLWGVSGGKPISIALLGSNVRGYAAFRLQPSMTELAVTAEPEGGTAAPTTPVLVSGVIPRSV